MIGKTISHYRIVEKLGQGGMGIVYKAEDTNLRRTVALKFLPGHLLGDDAERARFLQEARAAAALDHPNICTIYEIQTVGDETFIAMACVEGENLLDRIAKGPLPLVDAVTFGLQLANALHEAHSKSVVHRDIKPSNVVISDKGHAILMDFGLAKLHGQTRITQAGTTLGTVAYMSPEQSRGEDVDARTDIWSLGVMLYEMITGRRPFLGEHASAVIYAINNTAPTPLTALRSDVPMELERIVGKMLVKDRNARYQTIEDVRVDLKAIRKALRGPGALDSSAQTATMGTFSSAGGEAPGTGFGDATPSGPGATPSDSSAPVAPSGAVTPAAAGGLRRWAVPLVSIAVIAAAALVWSIMGKGNGPSQSVPSETAVVPGESFENSLAVLPLKNLSGDEKNEYFVDGMTEELITQLAGIRALKVISRTSIMRYKNADEPLTQIAKELGVRTVLEGSVLWAGDRVRITVQLIDGTNDAHLWANSYESDMSDVLGLQRRVARAVAEQIQLELTPEEETELAKSPVVDNEAHQLYLKGRHLWNLRTVDALHKSIGFYEAAIKKDPNYAAAYAGLADTYVVLPSWDFSLPASETYPKAKQYALKALDLDPSLAGPNAVLGGVTFEYEWNWEEGERYFRRAIELNPGYATAHQWYAEALTAQARYDEATREAKLAVELNPLSPVVYTVAVWAFGSARKWDEATTYFDQCREINPSFGGVFSPLTRMYLAQGRLVDADSAWATSLEMTAGDERERDDADRLMALADDFDAFWHEVLRIDLRQRRQGYLVPAVIATDYAIVGEADSAVVWLEKGFEEPSVMMALIASDPRFDPIRDDERFQSIIRRLRLEKAQERYLRTRDKGSS